MHEIEQVIVWLRNRGGMSILLVEQFLDFVLAVVDQCYVMASPNLPYERIHRGIIAMLRLPILRCFTGLVLLCVAVPNCQSSQSAGRLLLKRSYKVMSTKNWEEEIDTDRGIPGVTPRFVTRQFNSCWVSDGLLLYVRQRKDPNPQSAFQFVLRDVAQGTERSLPNIRRHIVRSKAWIDGEELSPDRQWILVKSTNTGTFSCRLDGSGYQDLDTDRWESTCIGMALGGTGFYTLRLLPMNLIRLSVHFVKWVSAEWHIPVCPLRLTI